MVLTAHSLCECPLVSAESGEQRQRSSSQQQQQEAGQQAGQPVGADAAQQLATGDRGGRAAARTWP